MSVDLVLDHTHCRVVGILRSPPIIRTCEEETSKHSEHIAPYLTLEWRTSGGQREVKSAEQVGGEPRRQGITLTQKKRKTSPG